MYHGCIYNDESPNESVEDGLQGKSIETVFGCTIRFFTRAAYSLCGNDMFILLYVKRNSEV